MSDIIVQKFGGTSVGSVERIDAVAEIIKNASLSERIIVVVSAMSGETNRLLSLAEQISTKRTSGCEMDMLLATGEQVTISLLGLALQSLLRNAESLQ